MIADFLKFYFLFSKSVPGGSTVCTLRPAEVKWPFTPSGSKNGSLHPAEVKCIFTPGGSKTAFYARRE